MNYNKSGFALQYANGSLAAIDKGFGVYSAPGYPYEAICFAEVEVSATFEEAEKNARGFNHLKVVPITIEVKVG